MVWKWLITYKRFFRQIQQEQNFSLETFIPRVLHFPKKSFRVSDPEVFYHGWQIKYLFTSVVLRVSHTTTQVMICLLFNPLFKNILKRLNGDNSQGREEWL